MRKNPTGFLFLFENWTLAVRLLIVLAVVCLQIAPSVQASPGTSRDSGERLLALASVAEHQPLPVTARQAAAPAEPAPVAVDQTITGEAEPFTPPPPAAPEVANGGLVGSTGYAQAYGNCVNEPGVNNPGYGNPIGWPVTSSEPSVGATALFTWNHTGVVTGIWANGDVEVRHQNYWGGQHRFPRSMFRGFR